MNNTPSLEYLVEHELFRVQPLLNVEDFVKFCHARGINTSAEQLEQFEQLGILQPVARLRHRWLGDDYEMFLFTPHTVKTWLVRGQLWEPTVQPFQPWAAYYDAAERRPHTDSLYSVFQCYTLYHLVQRTAAPPIRAEWLATASNEVVDRFLQQIRNDAAQRINRIQAQEISGQKAVRICQTISNRYYPQTQTDRRTIHTPAYSPNEWDEYKRRWDAHTVFAQMRLTLEELRYLQETVARDATTVDPLVAWRELVSFVAIQERQELRGTALLAQMLYAMEHMLRLFYEDLTGVKLPTPYVVLGRGPGQTDEEAALKDRIQRLEFLTNKYHLNPRPQLILVVEGDGEEQQYPRLLQELWGLSFQQLSVEVINIEGVSNFTGEQARDKRGALERFIDYHHSKHTLVFIVLDKEGRVPEIKNALINHPSKFDKGRTVTRNEYIYIWNRSIEFDNFSDLEIARALTELGQQHTKPSQNSHLFTEEEIRAPVNSSRDTRGKKKDSPPQGDPLSRLYRAKLNRGLNKPDLLALLFGYIIADYESADDTSERAQRPIVQVLQTVIELARRNYLARSFDEWALSQQSDFFGSIIPQEVSD